MDSWEVMQAEVVGVVKELGDRGEWEMGTFSGVAGKQET